MKTGRKLIIGCGLGIASAVLAAMLWLAGGLEAFEYATWDIRVRRLAEPSRSPIRLILLDQASLDWGRKVNGLAWPWPREVYAPLIEYCRNAGARSIAFDVLFTEPSLYNVDDDKALGAAIAATPMFVGTLLRSGDPEDGGAWQGRANPFRVAGLDRWTRTHHSAPLQMPAAVFEVPEVGAGIAARGHVRGLKDADNIIRRAEPLQTFDGQVVPMLGLAAYLVGQTPPPVLKVDRQGLAIGNRRLPLDRYGRTILRYRKPIEAGSPRAFTSYSAAAVIESKLAVDEGQTPSIPPEAFRDCYVLFGYSASALYDTQPTPMNRIAPGVTVHATLIDNLIAQDAIAASPTWAILCFIALWSIGGGIWTLGHSSARAVAAGMVIGLMVPAAAGAAGYQLGVWWPIVAPQVGVVLAMVAGLIVNYATEGRQRRFIKRAFTHYLSAQVVERIASDPSALRLGGELRELSIFFSDVEGFSGICHDLDAQTITALLNDYLTEMTRIIFDEGGTLDKYEGDAVIAFWNAPTDQTDHRDRAVRTAIRCQRRIEERRSEFSRRAGGRPFRMRIGIHSGEVVVGNMGSAERFDYSMLGDAANLAARLEGANKAFGTYTMVSQETWSATQVSFMGRLIGDVTVVGRATPVSVYEPIGFAGETLPDAIRRFEEGAAMCRRGGAAEALVIFKSLANDPVAATYARRIEAMDDAERNRWDGVWNLTEK